MFCEAQSFNQSLDEWKVTNVTDMSGMFYGAVSFQQSLRTWAVAPTTDIANMFDATFDTKLRPRGVLPDPVPFETGDMSKLPLTTLLRGLLQRKKRSMFPPWNAEMRASAWAVYESVSDNSDPEDASASSDDSGFEYGSD
eukprot:gene11154-biopygen5016